LTGLLGEAGNVLCARDRMERCGGRGRLGDSKRRHPWR
jgi:hypothetical protein